MVVVLETQLGAQQINLDSEGGWVEFDFTAQGEFTYASILSSFEDATYKVTGIEARLRGQVVAGDGGDEFECDGTGQRFVFHGDQSVGWAGEVVVELGADGSLTAR